MLARNERLRTKADFDRIFKRGRSVSSPLAILRWNPNGSTVARFGFIISNKTSKKAVLRNKARRRLRDIVRAHPNALPGYDYVVIAKQSLIAAPYASIRDDTSRLLEKSLREIRRAAPPPLPTNPLPRS